MLRLQRRDISGEEVHAWADRPRQKWRRPGHSMQNTQDLSSRRVRQGPGQLTFRHSVCALQSVPAGNHHVKRVHVNVELDEEYGVEGPQHAVRTL